MAKMKKAQNGRVAKYVSPYKSEKTADSTQYFKDKEKDINRASSEISKNFRPVTKGYMLDTARRNSIEREYDKERQKVMSDLNRQGVKGKPGFDKYGNPVSYKQASGSKKKAGGNINKAKDGQLVPSEMKPGTMIKKADRDARATKMADALNKQAGKGKYAPSMLKAKQQVESYEKNKKARLNEAAKKSAIQSSKEISKSPAKAKAGKMIKKAAKKK